MIMPGMEYSTVSKIYGPLMIVQGVKGVAYGEVVEIETESGEKRKGQVLEAREDMAIVQVFEGTRDLDIKTTRVRFHRRDPQGSGFNGHARKDIQRYR